MKDIYSFWISGKLTEINWLSIKSFLKHGHKFILYTYERSINLPENLDTANLELRDAREIMPESEIFYYNNMCGGNPNFRFGGIAERLKAEMLYALGGWHVDLDVICLKKFNEKQEYVLRPHPVKGELTGIVGNIIKAPKHSELAKQYVAWTKQIDADNTDWEKSFRGLSYIVKILNLQEFIAPVSLLGYDDPKYWRDLKKNNGSKPTTEIALHMCNAMQEKYETGSFYHSLLKEYNLC